MVSKKSRTIGWPNKWQPFIRHYNQHKLSCVIWKGQASAVKLAKHSSTPQFQHILINFTVISKRVLEFNLTLETLFLHAAWKKLVWNSRRGINKKWITDIQFFFRTNYVYLTSKSRSAFRRRNRLRDVYFT